MLASQLKLINEMEKVNKTKLEKWIPTW